MSRTSRELVAATAFLLLFAFLAWLTLDFGPRARLIPLPLTLVGAALALLQIVVCLTGSGSFERMKMIEVEASALPPSDVLDGIAQGDASRSVRQPVRRREWIAYVIVIGLPALIVLVGPVIAMFVFTAGYFVRTRVYSPLRSMLFAGIFTGIVYLLFFTTLQIEPYYGLLAPLFAHDS